MYIISYVTSIPHDLMVLAPMETIYEYQLWRLFTSPYVCNSLFFDILFVMPLYLAIFLYHKEFLVGSFHAWLYFTFINMSIQLIAISLYIPIALAFESNTDEATEPALPNTLQWAFFSALLVEVFRAALSKPKTTVK